ncbi:hypothetical protein CDD80_4395 [Ophiocordyceps camponoti-rufipedis]|uniref:Uncharacterized protein n=1 Tax=Ophiocordyceps camponoti-rufipedis TaxID=2004952 RepID=A0A2C5YSZ8_9HYPO|nr:hypothetical protein CDD80_4395 [Ophiocordyceps camponoti-rufipedis]
MAQPLSQPVARPELRDYHDEEDDYNDDKDGNTTYSQFACIGVGFSGIALGATLKRWHNIQDVRFFERRPDIGGTWSANRYPGCAVDIPGFLYSFSFAPNPDWTGILPAADEIRAYLRRVADRYGVTARTSFGAHVIACHWRSRSRRWRLVVRYPDDGGRIVRHDCRFLFGATGVLVHPKDPGLVGLDSFRGRCFHTASWPADLDLSDKRVVVVGNGCTASQVIPAIIGQCRHLSQFIRSRQWFLQSPPSFTIPPSVHWLLAHVPGLLSFLRLVVFFVHELHGRVYPMTAAGHRRRAAEASATLSFVRSTAPAQFHAMLEPDYAPGCKRRVLGTDYVRSLNAPNISVTEEPIVEVLPDGVRSRDGAFTPADVIILASGFLTGRFMHGIDVRGSDGRTLDQHWKQYGGAEAYNCCALSHFPNMFMLLGPNTITGHTSCVMAIENGVNYALRVIRPILDSPDAFVEVKPEAEARYSRDLQQALGKTVYLSGCISWYNQEGPDGRKWNSISYPRSQAEFWYRCLFPVRRDWNYVGAPHATSRSKPTLLAVAAAVLGALWLLWRNRGP